MPQKTTNVPNSFLLDFGMLGTVSLTQVALPISTNVEKEKEKKVAPPRTYTAWEDFGVAQRGVRSMPVVACRGSSKSGK